MTRLIIFIMCFYVGDTFCGVTITGTRFFLKSDRQSLNINVNNDNEADYLIKSNVDDNDFFVSPPLFVLNKKNSGIITVIAKKQQKRTEDRLVNLTLTFIPKTSIDKNANIFHLAVRNHFRIIIRHKNLTEDSFSKLMVVHESNQCILVNNSSFVFTVSVSKEKNSEQSRLINISPGEKVTLDTPFAEQCNGWVSFYNEFDNIIKNIKLPKTS